MNERKDNGMGRVQVEFTVANYEDVLQAEAGTRARDQVRRVPLKGLVDTGATRLVLPASVVAQLGLSSAGEVKVRYADQRGATRPLVRNAWVELLGRAADFSAIVEQDRTEALIGAIVLEELDFVVDCTTQTLHPRDPDRIVSEIE
jgi:predicted aspartyl protease